MHLKSKLIAMLLLLVAKAANAQKLPTYHHNNFWGRIVLADKLTDKLKREVYLQKRTQNDPTSKVFLKRKTSLVHSRVNPKLLFNAKVHFNGLTKEKGPAGIFYRLINR